MQMISKQLKLCHPELPSRNGERDYSQASCL